MTDETKRVQISIHLDEALLHQLEAAAKQEIRSVSGEAAYYDNGGDRHVAACLAARDISQFNPKAPPPKTPAFWDIVDANRAPEDSELADLLDELGNPATVTLTEIRARATGSFLDWLQDRKNRRAMALRMHVAALRPDDREAKAAIP